MTLSSCFILLASASLSENRHAHSPGSLEFAQALKWSEVKWSEVAQSCPTLCDPTDYSLPGFSVHGIFQARLLEWVAISFSRGSSQPRDWTQVSRIGGRCFTHWATRELEKWLSFLPTTHLFSWLFFLFSERMALHILNLFQFGSFWPRTEQAWGWN